MRRAIVPLLVLSTVSAGSALAECPVGAVDAFQHPSERAISAGYGMQRHPILGVNRLHAGVDYAGPIGDEVTAAAAGVVVAAGQDGMAGFAVTIRHAGGRETRYHHMLMREIVKAGDCVAAGQRIGLMGNTGLSTGPHLHFEVVRDGQAIDPETVLPKR